MRFALIWSDSAYQELAAIYARVGNAEQFLDGLIDRFEEALARAPDQLGGPADGDWYYRQRPMTVFYTIDFTVRQVTILSVAFDS